MSPVTPSPAAGSLPPRLAPRPQLREGGPAWLLDQGLHGEGLHPLNPKLTGRCPGKSPDLGSGWTGGVVGCRFPSSRDGSLIPQAECEGPSRGPKARTGPAAKGGSPSAPRERPARQQRPLTNFVPHLGGNSAGWSRRCAQLLSHAGRGTQRAHGLGRGDACQAARGCGAASAQGAERAPQTWTRT